ncbi:hypothetical protein K3495_g4288 [Podosphaera aphanis]|nr:hypothetical protein K3495_g4288 [Podosphaera aphanis]
MPVDYSKWDNLELSDDSDIEVHPNVDKKSFIRAKQNQIHQKRYERKTKIATYKYERIINEGLLKRIKGLVSALQSFTVEEIKNKSPDELVFQAITQSVGDATEDTPPPRPAGVHTEEKELPSYSKMIAVLIDQVKTKIDEEKSENRLDAYLAEIKVHQTKVEDLQEKLLAELSSIEKEESKLITSESYHTGFEMSQISKPDPKPASKDSKTVQSVEVLNPHALEKHNHENSSAANDDLDEPIADDEDIQASETGKQFALIKVGDYQTALQFISKHPDVLTEKETDALLVMAFDLCIDGQYDKARQCVHQGLLLQYCRVLGRDGVGLFFKRVTTPGHQAQKVFIDDVNSTFARIKTRAKEIQKQRAQEEATGAAGVETIQLHAVDPGTTINIIIPPKESEDPAEIEARKIFENFSPELQEALESRSLDNVNKILGRMSVEEGESVVGQLGESGILSLEEEIIDATTEEGQKALKRFEDQERAAQAAAQVEDPAEKYSEDPE